MWVDTHSHLCRCDENDYFSQLNRAKEAGVCGIINIGTNIEESKIAFQRAKLKNPIKIFAAVGICVPEAGIAYQNLLDNPEVNWIDELREIAEYPEVVAIGETGLDGSNKDYPPIESQIIVFEKQAKLAKELDLPLIVHSRKAEEEVLSKCREIGLKKVLFHCFTGDAEVAKKITDCGYFISFSGIVTFNKSGLDDTVKATPLDFLMIETDAPWLSPTPFRGKPNESKNVKFVGQKIAQIKEINEEELAQIIKNNAQKFFEIVF